MPSGVQKTINFEIDNLPVAVNVAHSRRRTWQLSVSLNGGVMLKAPLSATPEYVDKMLKDKSAWIAKTRDRILRRIAETKTSSCHDGSEWFVFGQKRILNTISTQTTEPRFMETETGWQAFIPADWALSRQE